MQTKICSAIKVCEVGKFEWLEVPTSDSDTIQAGNNFRGWSEMLCVQQCHHISLTDGMFGKGTFQQPGIARTASTQSSRFDFSDVAGFGVRDRSHWFLCHFPPILFRCVLLGPSNTGGGKIISSSLTATRLKNFPSVV